MTKKLTLALTLALGAASAQAVEAYGIDWSGSGFLTLAAGRVFGGTAQTNFNGYTAPAFVADYGQAGIYEKNQGWSAAPDSKLGLQGTAKFNSKFSVTGQVVTRGANNGNTNLEWLYGTYSINDAWSVQFGRKRLPLFYYSESQDVGLSMPWVRLPPQAYGWDIVNYDGVNLMNRSQWGEWSASSEVFYGNEKRNDNPYQKIYNGKHSKTNEKWSNIAGGDITLSRDWFEARFMYMQSDWEYWDPTMAGVLTTFADTNRWPKTRQKFYSAAFNADYENWVIRSEFSYIDRREADENDFAQLLAVGYRIGKWLPMATVARYEGNYIEGGRMGYFGSDAERHTTYAVSLRYDLSTSSDIKVQYDYWKDRNGATFNGGIPFGSPRLLSISYDMVF
ncbi:MAG TPA: hypothetical protein VFW68_03910 [Rhodocyclaceae bacterium]|nr:hypothetical protein [Rhodocyclaceae bacterium]